MISSTGLKEHKLPAWFVCIYAHGSSISLQSTIGIKALSLTHGLADTVTM